MAKDADDGSYSTFPSTLLSTDNSTFEKHLKSRSSAISSAIQTIFSEDRRSEPSISELQERIARLLLAEKLNVNELETIRLDKELLRQRLETASMRYLKAERNIDRARSITVVKIERQAIASSGSAPATETAPNKNESANGQVDNAALVEAETATKEAAAASAKKAEQIEKLETENSKLIAELTAVRARLSHLTDDDYANTDLFKQIKLQHDDVVNRINGLEAVNTELRQENQKLQGERSAYRMQLDAESQAATSERDLQLSKVESDLTRIRTTRDELSSDLNIRKASQEQERASINQMKQFLSVKDDRINALEAQVKRLEADQPAELGSDIQDLSLDDVQGKYSDLERKYSMLKMELDSITSAYKKVSSTTSQKINNLSELEEKAARLSAEKAKADQKYFAAMKAKDARDQEIRALRAQNSKSSDIVSQLKDAEASTRALVANLEKNVCDTKELQTGLETKFRAVQKQVEDRDIKLDGLKKQVNELKNHLTTKDNAYTSMAGANRKLEVELEQMKVDAKEKGKQLEMYKTKGSGADGDTADMLRVSPNINP